MKELIVASGYPIKNNPNSSYKALREVITTSRLSYKPDEYIFSLRCEKINNLRLTNCSFEECCEKRVVEIERKKLPIYVLWSGGIDSTAAVVSILKYGSNELKSRTTVLLNTLSLKEYSELFPIVIKNFKIESSNRELSEFTQKGILVTGELGDQLFGSDMIFDLIPQFGFESLKKPFQKILREVFVSRTGIKRGQYYFDLFEPIVQEAPFSIKTSFDFLWWWNFSQKWQHVKFRCLLNGEWENLDKDVENISHFFDSEDFQSWSIQNHDKKIGEQVNSYKQVVKEMIVEFTGHKHYLKKMKLGSLGYIWFGKKAHFALNQNFEYIAKDEEFNFRRNIV